MRRDVLRALVRWVPVTAALLLILVGLLGNYGLRPWRSSVPAEAPAAAGDPATLELQRTRSRLSARLAAKIPKRAYVVVNTMENRLYLKESTRTLRDAVCSTGSYRILSAEDGRRWEFKTPRGKHLVQRKVLNPLWVKPDWAFVEEGEPIPAAAAEERFEAGALGRFGLFLGDGYLIHGTLYTRLLGMPVTHGCIRLGDEDLEAVYKAVPVGSPVYIY